MSIKIGILYPTRLSLYGDNANVKALKFYLNKEAIDVSVDSIDDVSKCNLMKYDFLYMGSGLESGLKYAELNLYESKDKVLDFIDSGHYFLVTGNAISALKHFKFYNYVTNEDYYVSDVTAKSSLTREPIRAFQNTKYLIEKNDNPIFKLEKGYGNAGSDMEGFRKNNLICTSLIGPILAINAGLRNYFIDRILETNGLNIK